MYNYMTPLKGVVVDETCTTTAEVEGHDMESLLFQVRWEGWSLTSFVC